MFVPPTAGPAGGSDSAPVVRAPQGIERAAPGPGLAAVLAELPAEQLANDDVVAVMVAAHRLANHYHALFLRYVLEVALRVPGPGDQVCRGSVSAVDEFAGDEIAAALFWSRTRALNTLGLAIELLHRLPAVGEALQVGLVDEPRAKAFADWTAGLSDEHAAAVVDKVLPSASTMTVGQIREVIQRTAIALDPHWAQRRYDESVRRRKVVLSQGPEGTASLCGYELPADRAAAGHARIATLANRCKRAGDKRAIDIIRADLYLGMINGTLHDLDDEQIVEHIIANPIAGDIESTGRQDDEPGDGEAPDGETDDDGGSGGSGGGRGDSDGGPGRGRSGGRRGASRASGFGGSRGVHGRWKDPGGRQFDGAESSDQRPRPQPPKRDESVWCPSELRVRVSTLVGVDDHPAELPGYGYIPATTARRLARRMTAGQWRYVVCTPAGAPVATGLLRTRPTGPTARPRRSPRGGLLELQLTIQEVASLRTAAAGAHESWADVVDEIASLFDGVQDIDSATRDSERTRRRFPDAELRRWIQVRDRACLFPGCRAPARQADQDHRIDHAAGGPTTERNLQSLCRHHHRLKQEGKWTLTHPAPMTWAWTSRLRRRYRTHPPPVMPLLPQRGTFTYRPPAR